MMNKAHEIFVAIAARISSPHGRCNKSYNEKNQRIVQHKFPLRLYEAAIRQVLRRVSYFNILSPIGLFLTE